MQLRQPATPESVVFLVRGERGIRFALGVARLTPKKIALLGGVDPELGNVAHVPIRDAGSLDAALAELEDHRSEFGAVIVDSLSDWWNAEQKKHEVAGQIPVRAWRVIRAEHEDRMRILTSLGLPVILLSEKDRPIERQDTYLADVRLRLFEKGGTVCGEILKDRTSRFGMGAVVETPTLEPWLETTSISTAAPARGARRKTQRRAGARP